MEWLKEIINTHPIPCAERENRRWQRKFEKINEELNKDLFKYLEKQRKEDTETERKAREEILC